MHSRPAVTVRVRPVPSLGNFPLTEHVVFSHIVRSSEPPLRNQTAVGRCNVHHDRCVRAQRQFLNAEGLPHIPKPHYRSPLSKAHQWCDARTKLRRRQASAYSPPEIWAVYRGFTVDPCSASPRRHQVVKPSDRPALHEVAVRTSQRPSPRRFRCVRAPGADPDWSVPF